MYGSKLQPTIASDQVVTFPHICTLSSSTFASILCLDDFHQANSFWCLHDGFQSTTCCHHRRVISWFFSLKCAFYEQGPIVMISKSVDLCCRDVSSDCQHDEIFVWFWCLVCTNAITTLDWYCPYRLPPCRTHKFKYTTCPSHGKDQSIDNSKWTNLHIYPP